MLWRICGFALAGVLITAISANAQCRGGGGQGATAGTGSLASGAAGLRTGSFGVPILGAQSSGQAAAAQAMMMAQLMQQQMARQQVMLAYQEQQQARQEQLAQRRYRAEQKRAQVAEGRARTRATLAAQTGLTLPRSKDLSRSVAWQASGR